MRLASFIHTHAAEPSFGAVQGDEIVNLRPVMGNRFRSLKELLQADAVAQALAASTSHEARRHALPLSEVRFLPVIPDPGKIWCCGLNYHEHLQETNNVPTEQPTFFLRVADSQLGHGEAIPLPPESEQLDYEGEIAVVIGKPGRRIAEADAWKHIAGWACYNDATLRDWQRHTKQWGPGKNFWRTGSLGPWMVTADELGPNPLLTLTTRLNGVEVQRATTAMMVHSIARQIAYLSTVAPLQSGDVIVTGTPGGVGSKRQPPLWMKPGDVVEVEVDRIGVLRNPIAAESDVPLFDSVTAA
ncbi:MAG: fumarylacetoacetate hydrolase family protein [Hydrogenophaga sp.]|uniref:fumarylacetoacetate hydrolase family protein n=1 Tax=Hydrogenophaga sp. TaxID=1904254 RepID=UPI00271B8C0A|nr:fumarylacetoacetate hydrolase family protein [Hydrogenophaga sp.]MDO9480661.1 fumarylacetoacetate hydrolase family protein [Hydrogenophaga sp.]MDP2220395.1 fumarylacetoacetate hydrolase family protein [Hydrogenophaga sp.]MDP3343190.1 fumarylacetoacetate hydrolase family protein [Hydrogenophaga sp.]MDP3809250.1 fumarylacetoacetate hydrolase family protein [Hydrogenophaga sp.]MDP3922536.1 fumarylacetoacetate hydrolase family protein [Hydrogenophaga sp.]